MEMNNTQMNYIMIDEDMEGMESDETSTQGYYHPLAVDLEELFLTIDCDLSSYILT